MMRLARYLAHAGVASRRHAEELIRKGQVSVNGETESNVARNVDERTDRITVRGKEVQIQKFVYYLLHKPVGYVCSVSDPDHTELVTDLVPKKPPVYPVGRLDKDSSGLLLLTNDGNLSLRLTHPRYQVKKTYRVTLDHAVTPDLRNRLVRGVRLSEGRARVDTVRVISPKVIEITIHQGWKRQVRRMVGLCGWTVIALKRTREGNLELGELPSGEYRELSPKELSL